MKIRRLQNLRLRELYGLLALVILVWGSSAVLMPLIYPQPAERALVGDQFGAVNALFTGLALAGLIATLLLQRKELALQRRELALTRQEHREARKQFSEQTQNLQRQSFEASFFEMLRLYHIIVGQMRHGKHSGRQCFSDWYQEFSGEYAQSFLLEEQISYQDSIDSFFRGNRSDLDSYFNHLYFILKRVESNQSAEQSFYAEMIRAQFSTYEHLIVFYYGLSHYGRSLKPLIERFGLLRGLPREKLIGLDRDLLFYREHAYGEADASDSRALAEDPYPPERCSTNATRSPAQPLN